MSGGNILLNMPNNLDGGRYRLIGKICDYSRGVILEAEDTHRGDRVAIKLERGAGGNSNLFKEAQVYRDLQLGGNGIPRLRHYGYDKALDGGPVEFLVMTLKGPNLREVFNYAPHTFNLERVLDLGAQMLDRVEWLHQRGYIHGNVKPSNFVLGTGANCYQIDLIDFEYCEKYVTENGEHVSFAEHQVVLGSFPFMSLNVHEGIKASRRDDLWSIGYTLILFLKKRLPWIHIGTRNSEVIKKVKQEKSITDLCEGYPKEFETFLEYCNQLGYDQKPDYRYLRGMFENLWRKLGINAGISWGSLVYRKFPQLKVTPKCGNEDHERMKLRDTFPGEFVGNGRFQLRKVIGTGSYGVVALARDLSEGLDVAIKFEIMGFRSIKKELKVYDSLEVGVGVPRVYFSGRETAFDNRDYMVMELLGKSLGTLADLCGGTLSLKTILMVAEQLIQRIELLHERGYLHGDIKFDNCVMGIGAKCNTLYLIDMGLATKYVGTDGDHVPCSTRCPPVGASLFMSANVQSGLTPSRRDDLISIGYTLLDLLGVKLPWGDWRNVTSDDETIAKLKRSTSAAKLCRGYPMELAEYLRYCCKLKFDERPDYKYLCNLFQKAMRRKRYKNNNQFDWTGRDWL